MILEEFVAMLGIKADTSGAKSFTDSLAKVGTVAATVFAALKTVSLAAWGFFDSTIRRAEELSKVNDGSIKVTKEQVEMSKKYEDGMGRLGKIIESVKIQVAFGFLPAMLNMVETYNRFLDANKDLIANGITKLLNIITYASQVFTNTIRFIEKLVTSTIGWKGALLTLGAVFIWLRKAMLLAFIANPITWVIAAIGVLLLLIDDFMTYLDGGESQFGEFWGVMLEWIEKIKPSLQAVWDMLVLGMSYLIQFGAFVAQYLGGAIKDFAVLFVATWNFITGIFSGNTELMKEAFGVFIDALLSMFRNLASLFEPLAQLLVSIMSSVWDAIVSKVKERIDLMKNAIKSGIGSIGGILSSVYDIITAPFAKAFNWISDKFSGIGSLIGGAISGLSSLGSRGASMATTNNMSSNSVVVNAPMTITSTDPKRAGAIASGNIQNNLNAAQRNQGSGNKI